MNFVLGRCGWNNIFVLFVNFVLFENVLNTVE